MRKPFACAWGFISPHRAMDMASHSPALTDAVHRPYEDSCQVSSTVSSRLTDARLRDYGLR